MFDRIPQTTPADAGHAARVDIQRLIALYDAQLANGATLSDTAAAELKGMAGIYDLDTDRADAEIWSDLRGVLTRQAPATQPVGAVEPLTLMLVEDDAETAADLTAALVDAGHRVVGPFHDAEAAEAAASLHAVDLALLDINLSGEADGIDLARSLKGRWGLKVLFLSGDVTAAARNADLAESMLLKPYTGRQLLDAVSRAGPA